MKRAIAIGVGVVAALWCPPGRALADGLSPLGIQAINHDLAAGADGTVHISWIPPGPGSSVHYGHIVDGALVAIDTVPGSESISLVRAKPRLAVGHDGLSVHTAFSSADHSLVQYARRDGAGWAPLEVVWDAGGSGFEMNEPVVGVTSDGTVHLIAHQWNETGPVANHFWVVEYFRKAPPGGFVPVTTISPSTGAGIQFRDTSLTVDAASGVHVGMTNHYRYAPPGGDFGPLIELPKRSGIALSCCGDLFVDAQGTVHFPHAAYDGTERSVDYTHRPIGGSFAAPPVQLSQTATECGLSELWPAVTADLEGRVYVVWAEEQCPTAVPFVRAAVKDTDGTWFGPMDLDTSAEIHMYAKPSMALADGVLHILWTRAGGDVVLYTADIAPAGPEDAGADGGLDAGYLDASVDGGGGGSSSDGGDAAPAAPPGSSGDCACSQPSRCGPSLPWPLLLGLVLPLRRGRSVPSEPRAAKRCGILGPRDRSPARLRCSRDELARPIGTQLRRGWRIRSALLLLARADGRRRAGA